MAARDLEVSVADHAEFPFDHRGRIRADEQEKIAANVHLGFHPPGRIDADIGDRPHERAQKVNLRSLPDARGARLGQDDPQRDIADEPALAAARKHESGDEHREHDEDERAGDRVDVPKFEALLDQFALVASPGTASNALECQ